MVAGIVAQWGRERPDLDATPLLVIGRISRISQVIDTELRPPFAAADFANGDFDVLCALRRLGKPYECRPVELSHHLLVTTGGITKRLTRLEEQGLVSRTDAAEDGRGKLVRLTRRGKATVDRMFPPHLDNQRRLLAGLAKREQRELQGLLSKLAASLEGKGMLP